MKQRLDPRYFIFPLACLALLMAWLATRWGIGTSPDSVAYISSARNLWSPDPDSQIALVFRPPFYPVLLALLSLTGLDVLIVARWLNIGLLLANTLLLSLIVRRSYPHPAWLGPLLGLLFLAALPLLEIHAYAWTEPLFILLGFAALYLLAAAHPRPSLVQFTAVALLLAASLLVRYAGLAFILTAVLALLWWGGLGWAAWRRAVLLGAAACLPLILWMGYNVGQGGSATGRSLAFHPAGRDHFWQAIFTLTDWLLLPTATPGWARVLFLLILAATAVGVLFFCWRQRQRPSVLPLSPFYQLLLLFVPIYPLFLLVSISFLDAATPLDGRILSPLYVALLFWLAHFVAQAWQFGTAVRWSQPAILGLLLLFLLGSSLKTGRWLQAAYQQGLGFSSIAVQQAPIMAHISQLPADRTLYSNSPDAVYMVTGRSARPLPRKIEGTTQLPNPHYQTQWQEMGNQLQQAQAVVIYFSWLGYNPAIPTTEELVQSFSLQPFAQTAEGTLYAVQANP